MNKVGMFTASWLATISIGFPLAMKPAFASQDVLEDMPGFSCVDDGNRICGPNNSEGKPAGCYDVGGVLVVAWPCSVVVNPDGTSNIYQTREA